MMWWVGAYDEFPIFLVSVVWVRRWGATQMKAKQMARQWRHA